MKKILIIEDELDTRKMLVRHAKEINDRLKIYETGSANEALCIAEKEKIDAFFVDIQLEDSSGYELAKELRKLKAYQFVPIVFITGVYTRELEAYRETHCYYFLIKPFSTDELIKIFNAVLLDYFEESTEQKTELVIEINRVWHRIPFKDIIYVEYENRRIVLGLRDASRLPYRHMALKKFMEELPRDYVRIHQAFVINRDYISYIDLPNSQVKMVGCKKTIPIGSSYRKEAEGLLNGSE